MSLNAVINKLSRKKLWNRQVKQTAVIILLLITSMARGVDMTTSTQDTLPVITAGLGKSVNAMIENSKHHTFDTDKYLDKATFVLTEPVEFVFDQGDLSFRFPPTKLLWVRSAAGCIYSIATSPHLDTLSLDQAYEVMENVVKQINQTTWKPQKADFIDKPAFKERIQGVEKERFTWTQYRWVSGNAKMRLDLKRLYKADSNNPNSRDWYIIDISIRDNNLQHQYLAKTYQMRKEINGAEYEPLPLSYWLDNPVCE